MNEISIVIAMTLAGGLWAVMAYSVGYKEGERIGFRRGKAMSQHAALYSLKSRKTDKVAN